MEICKTKNQQKKPLTISDLIPDCMFLIFKNFTFNELENIRQVSREFEEFAIQSWIRREHKKWKRVCLTDFEFEWQVMNLFSLMEELDIFVLSDFEFKLLANCQFSNILGLKVNIDTLYISSVNDLSYNEKIKTIGKCFPNLQKLCIQGDRIDIDQIVQMKNLTELELHFQSWSDKNIRFNELFIQLKLRKLAIDFNEAYSIYYYPDDFKEIVHCKTLEEIFMLGPLLEHIIPHVPQLPLLKEITCLPSNQWKRNNVADRMNAVSNDPSMRRRVKIINVYESLEFFELNSIWQSCVSLESVEVIAMRLLYPGAEIQFSGYLNNLREFHYMANIRSDLLYQHLKYIINKAPKLETLSIPAKWLDDITLLPWLANIIRTKRRHQKNSLQLQLIVVEPISGLQDRIEEYNIAYKDIFPITSLKYAKSPFSKLYVEYYYKNSSRFHLILN